MSKASQSFEAHSPQVTDDTKTSSSPDSDSDDEISLLQSMSLQGYETFTEPVTSTGFVYHNKMAEHKCEWDSGYPENPQRLTKPYQRCIELGLVQRCLRIPIRYATEDEIIMKHAVDHVHLAESTVNMTLEELMALSEKYDAWYANKFTYEASLIAAGSTISMVEHILHDKLSNGFAMVRPPGHHAMEQEFNGYCTFNNVALAAQFALNRGISKILIVDWDVHHGQGTQRMFYDDPRVLYFSIHRYEHGNFWPQLRESDYDYIGRGPGEGFNINIPLNKTGMTDSDYMAVFNMVLMPVAYEFQPQLVLISAGYDAAVGCPEGEMLVTPAMYAQMTHQLMGLAAGRVCVVLEGGYCLKSLAEGCALTLRSLLRDPCPRLPPFTEPSDSMMTTILNVIKILRNYWKCFNHFETLERSEVCPFADVNTMPPVPGVTFSTQENRPDKFEIMNCYPVQDEKVRIHFADLIHKLIAEANLSVAEHRCCYVFDAEMRSHKNIHDKSHPERPERISKIYSVMAEWKLLQKCLTVASRLARKSELLWIHGEDYLNELLRSQEKNDEELKSFPDEHRYTSIFLHQKSVHCALLSCGSLLNVVEAVLRGKTQSGVAIVRPPGHHAESKKAMGFCFFNNVAVAVKFAQIHFGLKRILILDWDVHHGNATQHQFYTDPSVLYISLHRYDNGNYFPGSSDADFKCVGFGAGEGFNVNIPWSNARMGDAEYIAAFTQIVMPIAYQFAPELVLVSAGFDCAVGDPLGGYGVTPNCFGHMTHMLMGLANGRVILSLEGGYNLNSLSYSMATCVATLLGYPCPMLGNLVPNERAVETIRDVIAAHKKYWSSLKGNVPIPSVRKMDKDRWVIVKEDRRIKTRSYGSSKSEHALLPRPTSTHPVRSSPKGVTYSASESSITVTSSSYSTDTSATKTTTAETSKNTGRSSTQSTGDTSGTFRSEQSSRGDTTDSTESSSVSEADRNKSNINAGGATSEHKKSSQLQQISEVPASVNFKSEVSETVCGIVHGLERTNPLPDVASVGGDSGVDELTSDMRNVSVAGEQLQQVSHPLPPSVSVQPPVATTEAHEKLLQKPPALTQAKIVDNTRPASSHSDVSHGAGDASGARPKIVSTGELSNPVFVSLVYGNEPDPEPLSIFVNNPLMASQEQVIINKERGKSQTVSHTISDNPTGIPSSQAMSNTDKTRPEQVGPGLETTSGDARNAGAASSSRDTGGDSELLGACGVSSRPNTVQDFFRMQGVEEIHAVQPLPWCPHLTEVRPLPLSGFNPHAPCNTCRSEAENWVCLTCYTVECSRFVNEHMLMHHLESGHNVVLSYADLSVWCYGCDHYVDNEVLFPMKNAAHEMKFGESLVQTVELM